MSMSFRSVAILLLAVTPLVADTPRLGPAHTDEDGPEFELLDGDRVVFLGNTLIERMARYGYVEAALTARWPDRNITFRNLGWSGDTVWAESRGLFDAPAKGYQRMLDHVGRLKPTVIVMGYGNVEAYAGKEGLLPFVKQYEKLLDDLTKVSAKDVRIVLLGILPHGEGPGMGVDPKPFNRMARPYDTAIEHLADRIDGRFISPFVSFYSRETPRGMDPVSDVYMTEDGIHLNRYGYSRFAEDLLLGMGVHRKAMLSIDLTGKPDEDCSYEITNARRTGEKLRFSATAAAVPILDTFFVLPPQQAGHYALQSDGKVVRRSIGPSITLFGAEMTGGPDIEQADTLRTAIVEKNRLYFQRWRPQNVTYIELFRKHEQGRFAEDVAVYEKLVAEKEAEIAKLRKPVARTYELIRVQPDAKPEK